MATSEVKEEKSAWQEVLNCFAYNLPSLQDDITEKLAAVFAGKRTVNSLREDIKKIKEGLVYKLPQADDYTAQILLDQITPAAALSSLRVIKNHEALKKFQTALGFDRKTFNTLAAYYAAPASQMFFDEQMSKALAKCGYKCGTDVAAAQQAITLLAEKTLSAPDYTRENTKNIQEYAVTFNIAYAPVKLLADIYAREGAGNFKTKFDKIFASLEEINTDKNLNSFLTVKTLLGSLTKEDALNMSVLSKEMGYKIDENDIFVIGCRYLRQKTPKEVASTLDALLKSLPYNSIKEENLGLAVKVMTQASEEALENARAQAQKLKDRSEFRRVLSKYDCFDGFTIEIAKKFSGQCKSEELLYHFDKVLNSLPFCSNVSENNDLACKVLLEKTTLEDAVEQASYRRDLKAKSLTEGLAPEVLKQYLGTRDPAEIIAYFEENLKEFNFWKNDEEKHRFALEALVSELNGNSGTSITKFVLKALEEGVNLKELSSYISSVSQRDKLKLSVAELDAAFQSGAVAAVAVTEKQEQTLDVIFD